MTRSGDSMACMVSSGLLLSHLVEGLKLGTLALPQWLSARKAVLGELGQRPVFFSALFFCRADGRSTQSTIVSKYSAFTAMVRYIGTLGDFLRAVDLSARCGEPELTEGETSALSADGSVLLSELPIS